MRASIRHLSLVLLAVTTFGSGPAWAQSDPTPGSATFVIIQNGVRIGTERVTVTRTTGGWVISATGQLAAPFNLQTNKFELRYATDWQPQSLTIDALVNNRPLQLSTMFGLTTATSEYVQGTEKGSGTQTITPRTIVLPNNFFAAYEGLAARLGSTEAGTRLAIFIAPGAEVGAVVTRVTPRFLATPDGDISVRQFDLSLATTAGPLQVEVWADANHRLVRVFVPALGVAAIRDDLSTVMAREEKVRNPGDEDAFIPGNGFSFAATITRPTTAVERPPVVVLVPGAGPEDRDYSVFGIPLFGQLAGALADAGYFVVRYDKRGVGQSGGRPESAGVADYADDVKRIVQWVRRRDDVDRDRIAVVAHGEGAAVALTAADIEGRIKAVALIGATASTGYQATLARQARELARSTASDVDKQELRAIQQRMVDAAMTGTGWEAVPAELRRQSDTMWFRTWLRFDPARALDRIGQPILILHGTLDREVAVEEATRLEELALRKKNRRVQKALVTGANHLLAPATTGEVDEYASLGSAGLSPGAVAALVAWLGTAFAR
ncbi:MAG TPA: alpha/beta fold hydrolase [Vicinamibacterales bacterium]|nr:alpha/beta fold hydrolase [Vicinamibacterales bacterium]